MTLSTLSSLIVVKNLNLPGSSGNPLSSSSLIPAPRSDIIDLLKSDVRIEGGIFELKFLGEFVQLFLFVEFASS